MVELCAGTSRGIRLLPDAEDELRRSLAGIRSATGSQTSRGTEPPAAASTDHGLSLPLIGRVAAGRPILAESHVESTYTLDRNLFERRPDYLLRIRGDSMRDAGLLDGDLLAVRTSHDARNGQIVVARIGHDVTVKRFQQDGPASFIRLLPENPAYEPIVVPAGSDDFSIEGIGVGLIRQHGNRR